MFACLCLKYVDPWNKQGVETPTDQRDDSQSPLNEEMRKNRDDAIKNRSPRDRGC